MKNKINLINVLLCLLCVSACNNEKSTTIGADNVLWYEQPAKEWMSEALPIGNGFVGAMLFGGTDVDTIQFSHEGLWSGGPGVDRPYHYGIKKGAYSNLSKVRSLVNKGELKKAHKLAEGTMTGKIHEGINTDCAFFDYGAQQTMGSWIVKPNHKSKIKDYVRELDIDNSLAKVSYKVDGKSYNRSYFASYPHKALVYRYQSEIESDYTVSFNTPHEIDGYEYNQNVLKVRGHLKDNGRKFVTILKIEGAKNVNLKSKELTIVGAKDLILYHLTGCDYTNKYPNYKNAQFEDELVLNLSDINKLGYDKIYNVHIEDYKNLYDRVEMNIGGVNRSDLPTDKRLEAYKDNPNDVGLINLYFQYARYLMISGSRPGTMPLHLQGKWNNLVNPQWACDYHFNINLQMCYWPAEITNLSECHEPLMDYLQSIEEPGKIAAKEFFGTRGWIVNTMNNAYGFTSPGWGFPWGYYPAGAAWSCRHLWEHYQFNNDELFLKTKAYPLMKSASLFWLDYLTKNKEGKLVSCPSYSPEHGGISAGASMDHQIAWDLFNNLDKAHDVLGIKDAFSDSIKLYRDQIIKPKIGNWGQLQEWIEDVDDPKSTHRHVSHLYALHPGEQLFDGESDKYVDAAKVSLNARGDAGTGWSRGWKINFWARLKDGDRALKLINSLLEPTKKTSGMTGGTYSNLLCAHPPFQLDGNMGGAAGIAEMLVQSHQNYIELLPSLPVSWRNGSVKGLKCRGGITVDLTWRNKIVTKARFHSSNSFQGSVRINGKMIDIKCNSNQPYVYE